MSKSTKKCRRKIKQPEQQQQQQQQQEQQQQQTENEREEEQEQQRLEQMRQIHSRVEFFDDLMTRMGWRIFWILVDENPRPPARVDNWKRAVTQLMGERSHIRTPGVARTESVTVLFKQLRADIVASGETTARKLVRHNEHINHLIGASVHLTKETIRLHCPPDTAHEKWRCLVMEAQVDVGSYTRGTTYTSLIDATPEDYRLDMQHQEARRLCPPEERSWSLELCTRVQVKLLIYNSLRWVPIAW